MSLKGLERTADTRDEVFVSIESPRSGVFVKRSPLLQPRKGVF
jgi:hypothetical protein